MLSRVQLFRDPTDCSPPDSPVHGIFQARILEQVAISSSRGIFRVNPCLLHCRWILYPDDYGLHYRQGERVCGGGSSFIIFLPVVTSSPLTGCLVGISYSVCRVRIGVPLAVLLSPCLGEWSPYFTVRWDPGSPPCHILAALSAQPRHASGAALSVLPSLHPYLTVLLWASVLFLILQQLWRK